MAVVEANASGYEVVGGLNLKQRLARAERRNKIRALLLVAPLFVFISITFLAPICFMMVRSFYDPLLSGDLPKTSAMLRNWDPAKSPVPSEATFATLGHELAHLYKDHQLGRIATRLNYDTSGMRSLIMGTGRKISHLLKKGEEPKDWRKAMIDAHERWGKPVTWGTIRNASHRITGDFYLRSFDLQRDAKGNIIAEDPSRQLYFLTRRDSVWVRTVWVSLLVTVLCVILGYPVAYLLANLPLRTSNLLMILVLLPFWTSLLVRTTAWVVVLQSQGVLNDALLFLGLIHHRVQLIFNRFGVVTAMTHILLPFMILPIYSVMKTIPPSYLRAAANLGAVPWTAFWRVYFPQSMPGIGAGALLVFILALGYYITPALVGGPTDQLVSYFIADHTNRSLNWGLASALGGVLLFGVLAVYILYEKLVGIDNMKLG